MRLCYISRNYHNIHGAGDKAKTDIEVTLAQMGAVNIGLSHSTSRNKVVHFTRNLAGIIKAACSLRKGDVLVLQYPLKKYYEWACNRAHGRGAKVITVIHDLGSFRRKKLSIQQEIERLSHSDIIIAHNEKMQAWLEENGMQRPIVRLGIFDYLSPAPTHNDRPMPEAGQSYSVMFVGNMAATLNKFLYDLGTQSTHTDYYLYGGHFDASLDPKNGHLKPQGFAIDHQLMNSNLGDFGLSWYGESLEFGQGKIGEYMAYNNPHKVSLYLRCETPVILWKHAGLASFVQREQCGLIVDSLVDLQSQLDQVTPEQYATLRSNARRVAEKIASGQYIRQAIQQCLDILNQ